MVDLNVEIPEDFFEEEERCGHVVSKKMKKIWAVEIDLLAELLRVCRKYDIKIFAEGGTLLGAVRHKGMIPWDDDIDMAMLREDYDKLCEVADSEFQSPYFFQTEYTDPGSLRGHAQLRNSNTTAILDGERGLFRFNQGIFIDIFPMDSVIDDKNLFRKQCRKINREKALALKLCNMSERYICNSTKGMKGIIKSILHPFAAPVISKLRLEERMYKKFEKTCQKYNYALTDRISMLSFQCNNKLLYRYRSDLEEIIFVPFEFIQIPIAKVYERGLRRQYGDYMQFVKGGSYHGSILFDVDKGYEYYIENGIIPENEKTNE